MNKPKDYLGRELEEGDAVLFLDDDDNECRGIISNVDSPKFVRIVSKGRGQLFVDFRKRSKVQKINDPAIVDQIKKEVDYE